MGQVVPEWDCRPALLAAELARRGANVVVIGGTARWLQSNRWQPRDLDVVVTTDAVLSLVEALTSLGVATDESAVLRCRQMHFQTGWGPLDVFVEEGAPAFERVLADWLPQPIMVAR